MPSPFYRVAVKALIFDEQRRLLLVQGPDRQWEVPGGGWEHDESLKEALVRELKEELGVVATTDGVIQHTYRGSSRRGYIALRLLVTAKLSSTDFVPGDEMVAAQFFNKAELLAASMSIDEAPIKELVDQIWP